MSARHNEKQCVEKQKHYSTDKGLYSKGYDLPSGHVWLWELDHKEGGLLKNWCLWIVVLEKTPKSPLDSKKIKPVILKGNQPWVLIGRTDAETKTPVFWSSDANSWLIGKAPDAGKNRGQRRRGRQRMKCLDGITNAMDMNLGKLWEMAKDKEGWHATVHGVTKRWTWLGNRTTTTRHIDPKYWLWAVIRGLKLNDLVWRKSQTGSSEELCSVLHLGRCFVWESSLELVHFYMGPKDKWWRRTAQSEARGRLCPPYQALVGLL